MAISPIMRSKPTTTTPQSPEIVSQSPVWLLHSQTAPAPGVVSLDLASAAIHYASCCGPPTANTEQLPALNEPSSYPFSDSQALLKGNLITMISNLSLCVPSTLVVHPTSPSLSFPPPSISFYLSFVNSSVQCLIHDALSQLFHQ